MRRKLVLILTRKTSVYYTFLHYSSENKIRKNCCIIANNDQYVEDFKKKCNIFKFFPYCPIDRFPNSCYILLVKQINLEILLWFSEKDNP